MTSCWPSHSEGAARGHPGRLAEANPRVASPLGGPVLSCYLLLQWVLTTACHPVPVAPAGGNVDSRCPIRPAVPLWLTGSRRSLLFV